jgi:hypothetical protein
LAFWRSNFTSMKTVKGSIFLFLLATFLVSTASFSQNDEGFIYGEVTTVDDQKFKGQLRWGTEETFWTDIFNSRKVENPYSPLCKTAVWHNQSQGNEGDDEVKDYSFMELWESGSKRGYYFQANIHQFAIQMGDLKALEIVDRSKVKITFKDGSDILVVGGSNDIGAKILVQEEELGEIRIRWDRISRVDFMDTPKTLKSKIGEPLYGTVKTIRGSLTGFVQWDHEECLSTDKLDGSNQNGKMSIDMGNIKVIERYARGVKLTLNSGKELVLANTNDVNSSNKGIVVKNDEFGKALIEWSEFESVNFVKAPNSGPAYSRFPKPKRLEGTVKTFEDKTFTGLIIYDIDEAYDYEILEGKDYNVEYNVPFRKIDRIVPKNYNYSMVYLKKGGEILLGDLQDVSDRNDGLLVLKSESDKEPIYIPWKKIKEIDFK